MATLNKNGKPIYWAGSYQIEWYDQNENKVRSFHSDTSYQETVMIAEEWLADCVTAVSYTIKRTLVNSHYNVHTPKWGGK